MSGFQSDDIGFDIGNRAKLYTCGLLGRFSVINSIIISIITGLFEGLNTALDVFFVQKKDANHETRLLRI